MAPKQPVVPVVSEGAALRARESPQTSSRENAGGVGGGDGGGGGVGDGGGSGGGGGGGEDKDDGDDDAVAAPLLLEPFLGGASIFAELAVFRGTARAVTLRASKLTHCADRSIVPASGGASASVGAADDGCETVWAWPADVTAAEHEQCEQVARSAGARLKLQNGALAAWRNCPTLRHDAWLTARHSRVRAAQASSACD